MPARLRERIAIVVFACFVLMSAGAPEGLGGLPLKPGEKVGRERMRMGISAGGVTAYEYPCESFSARMTVFEPGGTLEEPSRPGERIVYVEKGTVEVTSGGASHGVSGNECLYLESSGGAFRLKAGDDGAVAWDFLLKPRAGTPGTSAVPSVTPGRVFNRDDLQFCQPAEDIDARIIQAVNGQVCFVRMSRKTEFPPETLPGEGLLVVTRGRMEMTSGRGNTPMGPEDAVYLTPDTPAGFNAGPRGCDVIAVFSPCCPEYTEALRRRLDTFHTIIAPGTRPKLLIDGTRDEPGLTFTEGPSWMHGRLYFSNYYKFWKPWGSSDEGGVWVVEPDGSFRVLNKNVQTCGTTPLPNGNLAVCDLFKRGVVEMTPDGTMGRTIVDSYDGIPFGVANDVITDRKGGLYITDSSVAKKGKKQPGTALYYLDGNGRVTRVTEPNSVDYINGVVVSEDDETLFLNGSGELYVWMFDVRGDGTLSNKRPFAELKVPDRELDREKPKSGADGMTIDRDGNLYVATPLGVQVFDGTGRFMGIIRFPKSPSHCVFGGENLSTLYVTARDHVYSIETLRKGFQYPLEQKTGGR